jgi:multiple sugar transport system ATP-binding protein
VKIPSAREAIIESDLVLGVRPEHVRLDDSSAIRGEVFGVEYLGTTQVITITTKHGMVRARVDANRKAIIGDHVGLSFHSEKLSVFDKASGRALRSALHEGAIHG